MKIFRSLYLVSFLAFATGCVPRTPPPPTPAEPVVTSSLPVGTAIGTSARILGENGFDILTSDAGAGLLIARRFRSGEENKDFVRCVAGIESNHRKTIGALWLQTSITVTVTAKPQTRGSEVRVGGRVHTAYSGKFPESDTDCVSSGVAEQRVASALTPR